MWRGPSAFCALVAIFIYISVLPHSFARISSHRGVWEHLGRPTPRSLAENECAVLLQPHIQKVALMFLVRGDVYHEDVWTAWLGKLSDIVPASIFCNETVAQCFRDMPQRKAPIKSVYDRQIYYSIVVHTKPNYPGYKTGSIFDGRVVDERVETTWGGHSLVKATKILLKAALEDPYNQRFQLVCESTIPVRAPMFTHDQLIAQNLSRVGSPNKMWGDIENSVNRWPLTMYEEFPELKHHTKFHRQWITLIREHAHIVVNDRFLSDLHSSFCISDEQYIGTLLSWKLGGHVEHEYLNDLAMALLAGQQGIQADNIDLEMLILVRGTTTNLNLTRLHEKLPLYVDYHGECHAVEKPSVTHMDSKLIHENNQECQRNPNLHTTPAYRETTLYPNCVFFARKFNAPTAPIVKDLLEKLFII